MGRLGTSEVAIDSVVILPRSSPCRAHTQITHVREARNQLLDLLDMERPTKKACVDGLA